ncbi:Dehydroquinase class II-domain-containing protein [Aspergillus multicolor]|uniref:type II 3-dehydroquinate dehydratase n=1 Tax=Aspergillus multicolor TaxID=41759 RepID=UPI003CCCE143
MTWSGDHPDRPLITESLILRSIPALHNSGFISHSILSIYLHLQYTVTFTMAKSILLINGPNLNLLGTREPHIYGSTTLSDVEESSKAHAASLGATLQTFQSNHEGAIVDRVQAARGNTDAIIINPGAYTHTSVAIRDALLGVEIPFIELHVSNVHARESFRHHSYFSDKASGIIVGLGVYGYKVAVEHVALNSKPLEKKAAL